MSFLDCLLVLFLFYLFIVFIFAFYTSSKRSISEAPIVNDKRYTRDTKTNIIIVFNKNKIV